FTVVPSVSPVVGTGLLRASFAVPVALSDSDMLSPAGVAGSVSTVPTVVVHVNVRVTLGWSASLTPLPSLELTNVTGVHLLSETATLVIGVSPVFFSTYV